jgi:nucleotide-binding universal stress UspA family protein
MTKTLSPISDMVVVVDLGGERRPAVIAADIARRMGAHLTGVTLSFDPAIPIYSVAAPIPTDFIVSAREQAEEETKAALAAFEAIGQKAGIAVESRTVESSSGDGFLDIVRHCRLTDITVVGQQDPDHPEPMREALIEAILFQAASPTLIIPYAGVTEFKSDKAVIAWDGGTTAARAVRAALPLLSTTKEVVVAMVEEHRKEPGEAGADIGAFLARHGLNVSIRKLPNVSNAPDQALLNFASEASADWMVMGAFGHTRLREFLLGGVTRGILASATLPVLMVH